MARGLRRRLRGPERREGETCFRLSRRRVLPPVRRMAANIPSDTGDFRLLSRRAVEALARMPERARYLRGMTSWVGFRQAGVAVPARRALRRHRSILHEVDRLRARRDHVVLDRADPYCHADRVRDARVLRRRARVDDLHAFFTSNAPQGWTSVLVAVLLLGGMQMLGIGMVGQYIARIFEETKQRPLYFVAETVERGAVDDLRRPNRRRRTTSARASRAPSRAAPAAARA